MTLIRNITYYTIVLFCIITNTGCKNSIPMQNLGIDDTYYIYRMQKLGLYPAYYGAKYRWSVRTSDGKDSIVSENRSYVFIAENEGLYNLTFEIIDKNTPYKHSFTVNVLHEDIEYSPYISKVYEYKPAPGQFINTMPQYEEGDTEADILKKAEESISGTNNIMVSLGSYGGYITFGFDHTVMNRRGEMDFLIEGNSFYSDIPSYGDKKGGSSEPGIVMVSLDENLNGIPDDKWYELAGSEYYKPTTIKNYSITYQRPSNNRKPVPDITGVLSDTEYIPWTDNKGNNGFVAKNIYHSQDYYPKWIKNESLTFNGTLLPPNGKDESGFGSYFVLYSYDWGYADNHPNDKKDLISFNIEWAVDEKGNPVHLPGIDFVKVYTGVNQYCGWLGETSTEISHARDLHIFNGMFPDPLKQENHLLTK